MSLPGFDIGSTDIAGRLGEALGTGLESGYAERVKRQSEQDKQQQKALLDQIKLQRTLASLGIGNEQQMPQGLGNEGQGNISQGLEGLEQQQQDDLPPPPGYKAPQSKPISATEEVAAYAVDPNIGRAVSSIKTSQEKRFQSDRKRADDLTKDYRKEIHDKRKDLPNKKIALQMIRNAKPGTSYTDIVGDFLATKTGFEGFRSGKSAEVGSATKNYLLSDLSRLTGRPNQFIERTLLSAYVSGQRGALKDAIIQLTMESSADLQAKEIEMFDDLSRQYEEKYGYTPSNINQLVEQKMKPYAEATEKRLQNQFQQINDVRKNTRTYMHEKRSQEKQQKQKLLMALDANGNFGFIPKKQQDIAIKENFLILE